MKRFFAILLAACTLLPLLSVKSEAAKAEERPLPFTDVAETSWYRGDVQYIYNRELMNGTSAAKFSPEAKTTRAMLVTILYRVAGSPETQSQTGFEDVKAGSWYAAAVTWAAEKDIVTGVSETEFRPDDFISREQAATILYRYARYKGCEMTDGAELNTFPDGEKVSSWAKEAVSWSVAQGLINGNPKSGALYLQPQQGATRAQLAAILHRFCVNILELDRLHVAYIPLDNRPVNNQRPVYQMEGAGMKVYMPEESLYATRLDGQEPNPNGTTYGDREALLAWLKSVENDCDIFILSLDQLLSGGLVSSRALNNSDLSLEYEIIDYIAGLSEKKTVYVFDTVMRLASTVGYLGLGQEEYNAFRNYGTKKRAILTGEDLTIENIYAGYRYDENGALIETSLPEEALTAYHDARRRKLSLADRLLREADGLAGLFIGVDDSYPLNSIQTNEIAYLQARLEDRQYLFCGTDELGMMAVARAYGDFYDFTAAVSVRYFGGGEDWVVDQFDTATLEEAVEQHMDALGMEVVTENAQAEVLVLSRGCDEASAAEFVAAWKENDEAGISTIVIDTSNTELTFEGVLTELPVKHLLGYSCWGTGGNTMGIALSMGLTRLVWLEKEEDKREESTTAFMRALAFTFVKDIAYCRGCRGSLWNLSPQGIEDHLMGQERTQRILQGLAGKEIMTDYGSYAVFPEVSLADFSAPFNRSYEIRFQVLLGDEIPEPEPEEPPVEEPTEPEPEEPPTESEPEEP